MRGKNKCKILKEIRRRIAEENDIPLITKECTYQGECSGTCPRCESELRYLEQQLARRQALGKAVTVAALSVSLMAGVSGCTVGNGDLEGDVPHISAPETVAGEKNSNDGSHVLLPAGKDCETNSATINIDDYDSGNDLLGYAPSPTEETITELDGDVAYIPLPDDTETAGVPTTGEPVEFPELGEVPDREGDNG